MNALVPSMEAADRAALTDLLVGEAERLLASREERFLRSGVIVRTLGVLSKADPSTHDRIVPVVRALLAKEPSLYGASVDLGTLWPAGDPAAVALAVALLPVLGERRARVILNTGWWLREQAAVPMLDPVLAMLIGLLIADLPETRRAAVQAVGNLFRPRIFHDEARRALAMTLVSGLAVRDPNWDVRAVALYTLPALCRGAADVAETQAILQTATTSVVAIERRLAEAALADLRATPPA